MVALCTTKDSDPLIGSVLGKKYRIEARIGAGSMGVVYRATHVGLDQEVAVKVLHDTWVADRTVAERFAREARIVARLDSAHIVRVLDAENNAGVGAYIVMEYLDGETLLDRLEHTGALGFAQAASYVLQAISGLEQAHEKGIIHRDLKPENLFLARNTLGAEVVKVLDFGISKQSGVASLSLTKSQVLLGSPRYMAPEQVLALPEVDERADVWALGVVLYELTTGEVPFGAMSLAHVCAQIVNEAPIPPSRFRPELPPEFDSLIMACLAKDPKARLQNVAQLARGLRGCLQKLGRAEKPASAPSLSAPALIDDGLGLTTTIGEQCKRLHPWHRRLGPVALMASLLAATCLGLLCLPGEPDPARNKPPPTGHPGADSKTPRAHPREAPKPTAHSKALPAVNSAGDVERGVSSARPPPAAPPETLGVRPLTRPAQASRVGTSPGSSNTHLPNFGGRR
jgi:serine/threonine-protein kinase